MSGAPLLKSRYRIERELGRGGFGIVYLARDEELSGRPVVIKTLQQSPADDDWFERKFGDERDALARIDHPGVVGVLDTGRLADGKPFLVLQFIKGYTLASILRPEGLEFARAANILRQVGSALSAAHDCGIYHRDLKPANIMLQRPNAREEFVKIIDFGIATVLQSPAAVPAQTRVAGSLPYMAPEQLMGRPAAASDIYSMGVIAYEMLTGRCPFCPDSPYTLLPLQQRGVEVRPSALRPAIPHSVDAAILRALSYDPAARWPRADDFGEELASQFARSEPLPPTITSAPPPATRPLLTRKRSAIAAAVLVAVLAIAGAVYLRRPPPPVSTPAPAAASRTLAYSISVQRYRNGKPYQQPFVLAKEMVFPPDYHIKLVLWPAADGYLYLVNEGPQARNGMPSFNVLFTSYVPASQVVHVPERGDGFVFDTEEGTEKLWLVSAPRPPSPLVTLANYVNPRDLGAVTDRQVAEALRQFLALHSRAGVELAPDPAGSRTIIKVKGEILVHVIRLEHH